MSFIAGAHAVVGPYGYSQGEIAEAFTAVMAPQGAEGRAIKRIHSATTVDRRSLALPIEEYANLADFGAAPEARQYSGRRVEADWRCPFRAHAAARSG